jgi:hypothetical protein
MADARKMQMAYDALVGRFVLPLVEGGVGELDRPIGPGCLAFFTDTSATSPEVDERIFDAIHRASSGIAPVQTVPWPSPGLIALCVAAHNLLALTDPSLDGLFARGARKTILAWTDRWLSFVPAPTTRGEALARHAILGPLLAARRREVTVRTWMYTYRFTGRAVPWAPEVVPRFMLPRQEEQLTRLIDLVDGVDERAQLGLRVRLEALISRSPVTELLTVAQRPRFRFGLAALAVLSDPALRGAIARDLVGEDEWKAASVLARAVSMPLLRADAQLVSIAVKLLVEMAQTRALDGTREEALPATLDDGALRYAALLPAMLEHPRTLEELRILDDGDRAKLQWRAERLRPRLTDDLLKDATALLDLG